MMVAVALVAQGIEHGSPKAGVSGSNPLEGTLYKVRVAVFIWRGA